MGRAHLLRLQVTNDGVDVVQNLIYKGHHLSHLNLHKMPAALLGYLDESITCHVLNAIMCLCARKKRISQTTNHNKP